MSANKAKSASFHQSPGCHRPDSKHAEATLCAHSRPVRFTSTHTQTCVWRRTCRPFRCTWQQSMTWISNSAWLEKLLVKKRRDRDEWRRDAFYAKSHQAQFRQHRSTTCMRRFFLLNSWHMVRVLSATSTHELSSNASVFRHLQH